MRRWIPTFLVLLAAVTGRAQSDTLQFTVGMSFIGCYYDGIDSAVAFQSVVPGNTPVILHFCAGQVEACCDRITVYDGLSVFDPILYDGTGSDGDLTDLTFLSSNADKALTLAFYSNDTISCVSEGFIPATWVIDTCSTFNPPPCSFAGVRGIAAPAALTLFPDPATDVLYVRNAPAGRQEWVVIDASGRVVLRRRILNARMNDVPLDVTALGQGRYVLRCTTEGGVTTHAFSVTR